MRHACLAWIGLGSIACFEGGNATGLPCNADAQCGEGIQCSQGICGGPQGTTSETLPTTSMTTMVDDSTTMNPTTTAPTTSATSESGSEDSGSSGTTQEPLDCPPAPTPGACGDGVRPSGRTVSGLVYSDTGFGRVFGAATGSFYGDAAGVDLALLVHEPEIALHIVESQAGGDFQIRDSLTEVALANPYDVEVADFQCNGGNMFVIANQIDRLGYASYSARNMFGYGEVLGVEGFEIPAGSYSALAGDLIPDSRNLIDAAIAGNGHIWVFENVNISWDVYSAFGTMPVGTPFFEPWGFELLRSGDERRLLVGAGGDADPMTQEVFSFRIGEDLGGVYELVPASSPALSVSFRNPFALAIGDFDGDGLDDVAVGERNINDLAQDGEGTTEQGTVRFFAMDGGDPDNLVEMPALRGGVQVDVGLRAMTVADFDCDGMDDVLVGYTGEPGDDDGLVPDILFGGALDTPVKAGATAVQSAAKLAVGDVDGDGRPEGIIGDYGGEAVPNPGRVLIVRVD